MAPVAWLVIGQGHQTAVFLDQEKAAAQAVRLRGVIKPLVIADDVSEVVAAAYRHGLQALQRDVHVEPRPGAAPQPAGPAQTGGAPQAQHVEVSQ